jgi:hypothetical protein
VFEVVRCVSQQNCIIFLKKVLIKAPLNFHLCDFMYE